MTPILFVPGNIHPWVTFHPYGRQEHNCYADAERWRAARLDLDNYIPPAYDAQEADSEGNVLAFKREVSA
jgi:hypothetical protein